MPVAPEGSEQRRKIAVRPLDRLAADKLTAVSQVEAPGPQRNRPEKKGRIFLRKSGLSGYSYM